MDTFDVPTIIGIHELMMARFGGMRGVTEAGFGRLEAALAVPLQSAFGEPLFPDVPGKATALCVALIHAHPFSDGNKRIALVALDLLLSVNGYTLTADNDAMFAMIMALAQRHLDRDAVLEWVHAHLHRPAP